MELRDDNFNDYPLEFPQSRSIIKVIGVGGGGCNVVAEIYKTGLKDVDLMICNTDNQALNSNPVNEKIRLGTQGLGAGLNPKKGRDSAIASREEIIRSLEGNIEMVFITACLGGGTGTGAAPVIAEIAKSMNKLVVGVVTIPFRDEGSEFMKRAMGGLNELKKHVDSLLIIDNQKIYDEYGDLPMKMGFKKANDVLVTAVKSISEVVTKGGGINVDMNDVRMIMENSGMAIMGIGHAKGEGRAEKAVEMAFNSPLLNDCDLKTSKGALLCITCSDEKVTMAELRQAVEHVNSFTGSPNKFKRGIINDPSLDDEVFVTIIATGFEVLNLPNILDDSIIIPDELAENGSIDKVVWTPTPEPKKKEIEPIIPAMPDKPIRRTGTNRPVLVTEDENEIIELENVPAYIRKSRKNNGGIQTDIAAFSITNTTEGQAIIPNNRYLHQTQD